MGHWTDVLDIDVYDLSYESFVSDPGPEMRKLVSFVGLDWDERCARFHESGRASSTASNDQVRSPVHAGSVGKWERFAVQLAPLLAALKEGG
jgi:hypothetical protein